MTAVPWRMLAPGIAELTLTGADLMHGRDVVRSLAREHAADAPAFLRAAPGLGYLLPAPLRCALQEMRYAEAFAALAVRGDCPAGRCPRPRSTGRQASRGPRSGRTSGSPCSPPSSVTR